MIASLPSPIEGVSLAKYFSAADILCLLKTSSMNDLIMFFSLDKDIGQLLYLNNLLDIIVKGQKALGVDLFT